MVAVPSTSQPTPAHNPQPHGHPPAHHAAPHASVSHGPASHAQAPSSPMRALWDRIRGRATGTLEEVSEAQRAEQIHNIVGVFGMDPVKAAKMGESNRLLESASASVVKASAYINAVLLPLAVDTVVSNFIGNIPARLGFGALSAIGGYKGTKAIEKMNANLIKSDRYLDTDTMRMYDGEIPILNGQKKPGLFSAGVMPKSRLLLTMVASVVMASGGLAWLKKDSLQKEMLEGLRPEMTAHDPAYKGAIDLAAQLKAEIDQLKLDAKSLRSTDILGSRKNTESVNSAEYKLRQTEAKIEAIEHTKVAEEGLEGLGMQIMKTHKTEAGFGALLHGAADLAGFLAIWLTRRSRKLYNKLTRNQDDEEANAVEKDTLIVNRETFALTMQRQFEDEIRKLRETDWNNHDKPAEPLFHELKSIATLMSHTQRNTDALDQIAPMTKRLADIEEQYHENDDVVACVGRLRDALHHAQETILATDKSMLENTESVRRHQSETDTKDARATINQHSRDHLRQIADADLQANLASAGTASGDIQNKLNQVSAQRASLSQQLAMYYAAISTGTDLATYTTNAAGKSLDDIEADINSTIIDSYRLGLESLKNADSVPVMQQTLDNHAQALTNIGSL